MKMFSVYDKERRKQLHKEIKTLSSVECESLITFYGAFHKEGSIGVILEYMDRGSLEFIVDSSIRLTDIAMAAISYQVTNFLVFIPAIIPLCRSFGDLPTFTLIIYSIGILNLEMFSSIPVDRSSSAILELPVN